MLDDVPDSSQEPPCHPRLQPEELCQIKSDLENSKANYYLHDLRNNHKCFIWFLMPLRNLHVTKDSNLENFVKSCLIWKIPKPITIYMISGTILNPT